tara:strand:- start:3399 stop:3908 length:510 start_codon:yes stop_codon:yes gene_type:complete
MNGDYGLFHKQCFFDGAVRIPLLVKPPNSTIFGCANCDQLTLLFDVAATISDYASDSSTAEPYQSMSLRPLIDYYSINAQFSSSDMPTLRTHIISEYKDTVMFADSQYKLMFKRDSTCFAAFNRQLDLNEEVNLINSRNLSQSQKLPVGYVDDALHKILSMYISTQNVL